MFKPEGERVGMAFSEDLLHWEKRPESPMSEADPDYYEITSPGQSILTHWRNPFLFDTDDCALQYVCARRTNGEETMRAALSGLRNRRIWSTGRPCRLPITTA